jgi:hypothetical protein
MYSNLLTLRRTFIVAGIALGVSALIGIFTYAHVSAQAGTGGQALEIGPPVMNLSGNPGDVIKTKISIRDISSDSLLVSSEINDFIAGGEDGTPKVLLDGEESAYSFKTWVSPLPDMLLKPKQLKELPVTITIPANASPGGYYGVVRFTATAPELENSGVSLSASLGALILLKVNGQAAEKMSIEDFTISHDGKVGTFFETAPLLFTERIKNEGNIHEEPVGLVTIKDMFGNTLATLLVNSEQRDILPASIRKFEQPLDETVMGNRMLFGLYTAELSMTYGTNKEVVTTSKSFWVIPYTLIGVSLAALVGGFFLLRFLIRRYNRAIIKKAQKRH